MKNKGFFRQLVSGTNGVISSKRVMGILTLLVCLGCMIYLVISEGGTNVVENLLQTGMVMAASLLGISSVTSIWKGNQVSMNGGGSNGLKELNESNESSEHQPIPPINITVECPHKEKENTYECH